MTSGRRPGDAPATSCPDCLSFGPSYGSQSYCRACYDFTRRYHRGECASCARVVAVKKGHCRDLSVTRTAEILGLAGILHDDRIPAFTSLP